MAIDWDDRFSAGAREMRGSALRKLFKETRRPGMISFAGGTPAPEVFPVEDIAAAAERALMHHTVDSLQYGFTEGYPPLREYLARRMAGQGIACEADQVQITVGSQQAIDLVGRLFIDPGTLVAVEDPTYMSAMTAWAPLRPTYMTVPMDDDGLRVDVFESQLRAGKRPAFLYTVSAFQNPTGCTISAERRIQLVELAAEFAIPIVEDDPYGELVFEGAPATTLAAVDARMHGRLTHVVYVSTFSKLVSPGLRVAWVAGPREVISKMTLAKQGMDLHASGLSQVITHEVCVDGLLERHLPIIRSTYRARRDALLHGLRQHMPDGYTWTKPSGGMFVWLTAPEHVDSNRLSALALERLIAIVPGGPFYANGGPPNTARLAFSNPTPENIGIGVKRLAEAATSYAPA